VETLACRCCLGPSRGKLRDLLAEAVCLCALEGGGLLERLLLANQGLAVARVTSAAPPIGGRLEEAEVDIRAEVLHDMPLLDSSDTRILKLRRELRAGFTFRAGARIAEHGGEPETRRLTVALRPTRVMFLRAQLKAFSPQLFKPRLGLPVREGSNKDTHVFARRENEGGGRDDAPRRTQLDLRFGEETVARTFGLGRGEAGVVCSGILKLANIKFGATPRPIVADERVRMRLCPLRGVANWPRGPGSCSAPKSRAARRPWGTATWSANSGPNVTRCACAGHFLQRGGGARLGLL